MKKLRDCTEEEVKEYCGETFCGACPLNDGICFHYFFENDKTMLSDKALDIELPIENKILDDEEKEYLTARIWELTKEGIKVVDIFRDVDSTYYSINISYKWSSYDHIIVEDNLIKSKQFKNMELDKKYTLEELNLVIEDTHKITIKGFFEIGKELIAIHCDTWEKSYKLLKAFEDNGYRYYGNSVFEIYRSKTCYANDLERKDIDWFKRRNYKIIEFEDIVVF